jgi:hypothetical protein
MHHDKSIKTALCKSTAKLKSLEVSSFKKESKNAPDTSKKAFEHLKLAGPYANLECTIVWLWCMRRQILEALRCMFVEGLAGIVRVAIETVSKPSIVTRSRVSISKANIWPD